MAKKGKKTAYVAVARKMLTVIWHLLVNGEAYVEAGFEKKVRRCKVAYGGHVPLDVMAEVLRSAEYTVAANVRSKKVFHRKKVGIVRLWSFS